MRNRKVPLYHPFIHTLVPSRFTFSPEYWAFSEHDPEATGGDVLYEAKCAL